MIAYLHGTPLIVDSELIIVTNGVGYGVSVTNTTLAAAADLNEVELYIYTHVKEDALDLYGFRTQEEKKLFIMLISISGVGPKTGLAITEKGSDGIVRAVQGADIKFFTGVSRVGKKLAQKIIIDLTPKLGSIKELQLTPLAGIQFELAEALTSLGFNEHDIDALVRSEAFNGMTVEQALPLCLKQLGSKL
ncbi:MAG: Holliday junction branch migration protein RuvA [Candidatus Pacebacteria bacterium]|nr:Holliday junction branch migration protein RuvA [Candidatus Paceibacterota bacterium]PIR63814.1 MAG: Holliday junction branch migration protein RuvA [Candidatus Pacebacteria bacterium CG10_big_fil_rev_8_21_14_0_10_40_26]PIZ78785.1 MAG: Holliday junction branch migration protein RuvA [Candidatus Pacebacteria bacterium CG_4_10_14_0_2_um_filter_40_20]PJA68768.1 MAG: Holliday junction branch migration protein RuvA [Candidatus Pacebacteria bacterium CG_4_9_14_3_um_filter_40_12]PJC41145.1 MAG: Hol